MTAFLLKTPPARHIDMIEKIHKWSTMLIEILLQLKNDYSKRTIQSRKAPTKSPSHQPPQPPTPIRVVKSKTINKCALPPPAVSIFFLCLVLSLCCRFTRRLFAVLRQWQKRLHTFTAGECEPRQLQWVGQCRPASSAQ